MGMTAGGGQGPRRVLAEINVTPLVDVMLVLLIIFMIAAGVQTVEMEAQQQEVLAKAERLVDEAQRLRREPKRTKVPIELPRVDSERVNLSEVKKLKLVVDDALRFTLDGTVLVDCLTLSPPMRRWLHEAPKAPAESDAAEAAFGPCLKRLGERLVDNHKLQQDKELYLLADRRLRYGLVLRTMAAVRQAGITKFGLVAQPGVLGGATVAPSPDPLAPPGAP